MKRDLLGQGWKVSASSWSRVTPETLLPYHTNNEPAPAPISPNKKLKENQFPELLPFLTTFFDKLSMPCPYSNQKTMSFSENKLFKLYTTTQEKPCTLSQTCFRRIWKAHFKKNFHKPQLCNGLCQLCEIGHKIEVMQEKEHLLTENERKKLNQKKKIVNQHKLANEASKDRFKEQVSEVAGDKAILIIDFKQNVTLGDGLGSCLVGKNVWS